MPAPSNLDGVLVQWGNRLFYPGNRIVRTRTPKLTGAGIHERAHATRQRIHAIVVRHAPQVMDCYKYQARRIREECRRNRKLIGRSPLDWPAMDRFLAIDAFVRVAETQNFAQAARQMRCSRSVITTRIQQLETFVGAPLFHRNTRSVRLSELGQAFLQDCVDLVGRTNDWALNKFFSDYGTW